jgi:integrase
MPAEQNGTVIRRHAADCKSPTKCKCKYQARWFGAGVDEKTGKFKRQAKRFDTKTAAKEFLKDEIKRVNAELQRRALGVEDAPEPPQTVEEMCDRFLTGWGRTVDPATEEKVRRQLKRARATFGRRHPDTVRMAEIEDWRHRLPEGSAHDIFRAIKQAYRWAFARGLVTTDPTAGVKNPQRAKHERRSIKAFTSWDVIESIVAELKPVQAALVMLMVGCGLRPEEAFALHRSDVDWEKREIRVHRRYSKGVLKDGLKRKGEAERTVPFGDRVERFLRAIPPRLDTMILCPAQRGNYVDLNQFRWHHWKPALRAAGVEEHRVYDLRHTYVTWLLERNVPVSVVAEMAGTSIQMIDATYSRPTSSSVRLAANALDEAVGQ